MSCHTYRQFVAFAIWFFLTSWGYLFLFGSVFGQISEKKIDFELPQGEAKESLRVFAIQSCQSLIFSSKEIEGIMTSAVSENLTPSEALKVMLQYTSLGFVMDVETGAFAILKAEPNKPELSPEPSSDNSVVSDKHNPNQHNYTEMKNEKTILSKFFRGLLGVIVATSSIQATAQNEDDEDIYELSPFVIDTTEDIGTYQATSTLAGARVRTELKDVASAISVITEEFLRDTGATDNQTLLQYTTNTEVGGIYGNYAGVGNTFVSGISEGNLSNPHSNTRVRGLDSADNTRNFFQTDIPWDSYIIDRVDLQRGPNSILFGIGSPAGIIDASPNTAISADLFEIENRIGSFGSLRTSLDVNRVIIEDQLMIRLALLDNNTKYRQKPAYNHNKRIYGAMRWEPDFFKNDSIKTSFRVNFENGEVESNNPRVLPPTDRIEGFFAADGFNGSVIDGNYASAAGVVQYMANKPLLEGAVPNYWIQQYESGAIDGPLFIYDNLTSPSAPIEAYQRMQSKYFALSSDGLRDGFIDGYPGGGAGGLGGYGSYAVNKHARLGNVAGVEAADKGFYKNRSLSDPTVFDFFNYLIDGPNKIEKQDWTAYNLTLDQSFFNGRLAFEAVYDYQEYFNFQESNLGNPFISVDISANARGSSWVDTGVTYYDGTGTAGNNPNAGRAYVGGAGGGGESNSVRESVRVTATGEIRSDDFLDESWLTRVLGRHVFTGLYTENTHDRFSRNWYRYGVETEYGEVLGFGGGGNPDLGNNTVTVLGSHRVSGWKSYLSDPLFGLTSAHGLNIQPITTRQSPYGTSQVTYFDSHWKWSMNPNDPEYVDPSAPYARIDYARPDITIESSQAENPDNYVGMRTISAQIMNSEKGDRDLLTKDASKIQRITESKALTWQGYFWDDTIVTTFGWRRDTQKQRSGIGVNNAVNGAASLDFDLEPLDTATGVATGETRSWGVVAHTPHSLRNKLPWGSHISVFYDEGNNNRVENRYGFNGGALPNATGKTKDYGFVINTLNDKLQLKVTWYETTVRNANISSVTGASSTLGNYQYELSSLEGWGTASALMILAGMDGHNPGDGWYWNWANVDDSDAVPSSSDHTAPEFLNHPTTQIEIAAVQSWLAQMQPQSWYDAFTIPIDVTKAAAGDYENSVEGWSGIAGSVTGINPLGGNRINGSFPTGAVDNQSEGVEIEIIGQLTDNWNISINASKQTASQIALGSGMSAFIEAQHEKFESPAGDLRLWWGGDMSLRDYYNRGVWAAYQFQLKTNGKMVAEMSPWRANFVTNYMFRDGILRGFNVGGGYRWQQGMILGYGLNDEMDNLDIDRPYWGDDQDTFDLWFGYQHALTDKINWRIQLNIRNVGDDAHLVPISIQPNGDSANYRIQEGQTWFLTNTFSF